MAKKLSSFEEAFKEARAEGKKTFTFDGKKYGTVTADDEQKRIDKLGSVSRQSGPPTTTQGATYPKASASKPKDKGSEPSEMVKGFRAAREKFGDTPFVDALMSAGKAGIALEGGKLLGPAGRALGAAAKKMVSEDRPSPSSLREKDPPFSTFDTLSPKNQAASQAYRNAYDDRPGPMKKGGLVKQPAKGGPVKLSEAARRGDGIAIRGRTKGKLY